MARIARIIAAALAAVGLAYMSACSGGGSDSLDTPKAVADRLGCTGYHNTQTEELYVDAAGTCTFQDSTVDILTFADNDARDNYIQVAKAFGDRYVTGDGYAIAVHGAAAADAVSGALG